MGRQFERKKFQIGNVLFVNREKGLFLSEYVDDIKMARRNQNLDPVWKILMKDVDLGESTSSHDHIQWDCTQRECQRNKDIVDNHKDMLESKISAGGIENYFTQKNLKQTFPHGPVTWKVMQRNAWKDIANLRTKLLNNFTKSRLHVVKEEEIGSVGEFVNVCT